MGAKEVLYDLIDPESEYEGGNPYPLLAQIREKYHADTIMAKIALAWKKGIKVDPDGHVILGQCVRASELQRELVDYDYCIVINREVWDRPEFTEKNKLALLDHEMCHVAYVVDEDGEIKMDSKGRVVWRIRGHDIEEFSGVIERHGCYKLDLEIFAQKILEQKNWLRLAKETQPELKIIHGEPIMIAPKAVMGAELIDPFPDGRVY